MLDCLPMPQSRPYPAPERKVVPLLHGVLASFAAVDRQRHLQFESVCAGDVTMAW
jgi:hypothetical protein